jgi:hypothetical protein
MFGKLVVLAALLSAVAYAAPTVSVDAVIPEEILVQSAAQVGSSVAMLKKQFAQVEAQLKTGVKVTPALAKVIDEMINMVQDEIEPAIQEAHASDQDELNLKHSAIVDFNTAYTEKRTNLYNEHASIQDDIDAYNMAAQVWDDAAKAYATSVTVYETTVSDKCDTCCDKQQAAVEAIEYTPAYASCDYTAPDAARCTKTAQSQVATAVKSDFAHGLKRYTDLVSGCSTMTDRVASTKADMDKKNDHCDDSQADCLAREKNIVAKKANFEAEWASVTSSYKTGIETLEKNYTDASDRVHKDEADRKNEWTSSQEIKCMLKAYLAGGSFDAAQMAVCQGAIKTSHLVVVYPVIPARVTWELEDYHDMTDYTPYVETCQIEEKADEDRDKHCSIEPTPADSTCDKSAANDGPVWDLSKAGASFQ